tara:strand:+ start:137 stop:718 length:582 start_codon:yes stop_codon:yes gene_type:complete
MNTNKILVLLSFVLFSPLISHSAVYIKIDGTDGEARDKNHKGWIDLTSVSTRSGEHNGWSDLQSFSQGLSQNSSGQGIVHRDLAARNTRTPRDSASGLPTGRRDAASGMATGKRQHKPIRVTKRIDKASPLLAKSLSGGDSIGTVTIQRVAGGNTETIVLQNATVAAVSKEGPREHVTFSYEKNSGSLMESYG